MGLLGLLEGSAAGKEMGLLGLLEVRVAGIMGGRVTGLLARTGDAGRLRTPVDMVGRLGNVPREAGTGKPVNPARFGMGAGATKLLPVNAGTGDVVLCGEEATGEVGLAVELLAGEAGRGTTCVETGDVATRVADPERGDMGAADPERGDMGAADPERGDMGVADPELGDMGAADPERGDMGAADPERGDMGAATITGGGASTRGVPTAGATGDPLSTLVGRGLGELMVVVATGIGLVTLAVVEVIPGRATRGEVGTIEMLPVTLGKTALLELGEVIGLGRRF